MSKHLSPAYQLYSAREDASNDLEGVLDQLSRMGYEGVEFAGFFERSAKEVRKLLKHTGLKAVSSHVPLQQIRDDTQSVLDYHEELECGCIAVPYLAEEDRPGQPGFARVLETLYTFGRQCKKRGIVLLYHNHDFEFAQDQRHDGPGLPLRGARACVRAQMRAGHLLDSLCRSRPG